jgi:HTH-type transcriptional regulator/antitoxin HipB
VGISQSRLSVLETDPSSLTFEQLLALMSLYELRVTAQDKRAVSAPGSW